MPNVAERPSVVPQENSVKSLKEKGVSKPEIERKFLITDPSRLSFLDLPIQSYDDIEQGYTIEGVRYRKSVSSEGKISYERSIKTGNGIERTETTEILEKDEFVKNWGQTHNRRLTKRRHFVLWNEHEVHLDIYTGKLHGLVVAEIEFTSKKIAKSYKPPAWFETKKGKIKEVTGKKDYSNKTLAEKGLPKEK